MHHTIRITLLVVLTYLFSSCSNAFLTENLNPATQPVGLSNLALSPDWHSNEYRFHLPSVDQVEYKITSKPSWLNISPIQGTITDSVAVVECSAVKQSEFSQFGVYTDFMTVKVEGDNYKVPVIYISEGNPKIEVDQSVDFYYYNMNYLSLSIQNTGPGVLVWDVDSLPEWLAIDASRMDQNGQFIMQYNSSYLPLKLNLNGNYSGQQSGRIVLKTNDKEHPSVTIDVSIDLGSPVLNIYTNTITLTSTEPSKTLSFSNYGSGILAWSFEDIPNWLTISPSSGFYSPYYSYNIVFTCDKSKLSPGENVAVVHLKTNDNTHPTYNITVKTLAPGNSEYIRAITGNVTDATFNKNSNTLYYVTSQPNSLIVYNATTQTVLHEIPLSKAPNCLAISEDWSKAAVGHNGSFSFIDLNNSIVTNTFQSDYSVHDIAWSVSDWYAYTQNGGSFSCLHWINMATGALSEDADKYSLDGSSIVKKVPGIPYLIATRNSTSPSGFFAYDIATRSKKSYAHMDLTNFWMSEDGQYIFSQNSNIYRTTSSVNSTNTFDTNIPSIGKINTGNTNYYGNKYIYASSPFLWVIQNDSYSSNPTNTVCQLEDNDYSLVKQFSCTTMYQADEQSTAYTLQANYVFANKENTKAIVLLKGTNNSNWIIQFIPVN